MLVTGSGGFLLKLYKPKQPLCMTVFLHWSHFFLCIDACRDAAFQKLQLLQVSNRIVHHVPTNDMTLLKEVVLASRYVASMVYKRLARMTTHNHIFFLRQSAGERKCSSMRSNLFEEYVIQHQAQGGDIKYDCKANSNDCHTPGGVSTSLPENPLSWPWLVL